MTLWLCDVNLHSWLFVSQKTYIKCYYKSIYLGLGGECVLRMAMCTVLYALIFMINIQNVLKQNIKDPRGIKEEKSRDK